MKLDNMFKKTKVWLTPKSDNVIKLNPQVPDGFMQKCPKCSKIVLTEDIKNGDYICPKCGGYLRVSAYNRVNMIVDEGSFEEWNVKMPTKNPMGYKGYPEKLEQVRTKSGLDEAVVTGKAKIRGMETVIAVCDGSFLMASMGQNVGEKITYAIEEATKRKLPVIIFACSGGARMQEGIVSLMQMAKTSAAIKRHSDEGLLYISVLTDPTTGGVTASFAMLGDIILAEPDALIGFAGPRVIEQTIGQKLPKGFQRSEFLLEHGFIDMIVERDKMRDTLYDILKLHVKKEVCCIAKNDNEDFIPEKRDAWERVQISRKKGRPVGMDYINDIFDGFMEFHGDRLFGDDSAIVSGIASFNGVPVTVIAQEKGSKTTENIFRNFGMPKPEGYRKALRLMKQAEKFERPIICIVDTPGAFCGIEAEERGQGEAIARNLYEMSALKTPIVSIIIGEGGSGGALAMATSDEVWMLENSVYSILSPEGFASILWKDSKRASEAAKVMKLTSNHLLSQKIVENVIREPEEFTKDNIYEVTSRISDRLVDFIAKYKKMSKEELVNNRYNRFRQM